MLSKFVSALQQFSGVKRPIEPLILEAFTQKNLDDARKMRDACEYTLKILPRGVPQRYI